MSRRPIDFSVIKAAVTPKQVLERIGWQPWHRSPKSWHGPCPIHHSHSHKSRSLEVTDRNWCCHVCGEHGDVIRLYALLAGITHYAAALAIIEEWNLEAVYLKPYEHG